MNPLPPATRRANRWLFIALVIFAVALAVVCFVWMRGVVKANGGIVDPQRSTFSPPFRSREPVVRADFALPSSELLPSYF